MRTTLNIDDDILITVKGLAQKEQISTGRLLSRLAREGLTTGHFQRKNETSEKVAGFHPFPPRNNVISNDQVNRIRDEEGV